MRIPTQRLDLVACTPEIVHADLAGDRRGLGDALAARVPEEWPPDLWDEPVLRHLVDWMVREPGAAGWGTWYVVRREDRLLIGTVGLKGRPTPEGTAEVGYTFVASAHRRGYATEAVRALVGWAFGHAEVRRVVAQAPPDRVASIRVMTRLGFSFAGAGTEEGTILYELLRPA